jgi:hypothetical protein
MKPFAHGAPEPESPPAALAVGGLLSDGQDVGSSSPKVSARLTRDQDAELTLIFSFNVVDSAYLHH